MNTIVPKSDIRQDEVIKPCPYVRITQRWSRNSGWAQMGWLYYVELVNERGEVNHGAKLHEYGLEPGRATAIAESQASFFGWEIKRFKEDRQTTVTLKEVPQ